MASKNSDSWLFFDRIVRFGEVDAAGVIHFYQLLRWCHEAWEESLQCYGLKLSDIFPRNINNSDLPDIALPIVFCEAKFHSPISTGDYLQVNLSPEKIDERSFQVKTEFLNKSKHVATGLLRHKAIDSITRESCSLPKNINNWLSNSISD